MRLRIVTPLCVIVDEDIHSLRAEDASGSFGILNGHAPFLTALAISIVSWRSAPGPAGREHFCALRGGIMSVEGGTLIAIATREAVTGDDLATLDADVLARFHADADAERVAHVDTLQLELNAIRKMVSRLHTTANTEAWR